MYNYSYPRSSKKLVSVLLFLFFTFCGYCLLSHAHTNNISVSVTKTGNDVVLNWTDDMVLAVPAVYKVYRATLPDMLDETKIATVNGTIFTDVDVLLDPTNYYYQIRKVVE